MGNGPSADEDCHRTKTKTDRPQGSDLHDVSKNGSSKARLASPAIPRSASDNCTPTKSKATATTILSYPSSSSTPFQMKTADIRSIQISFAAELKHKNSKYPGNIIFQQIFAKSPKAKLVFSDLADENGQVNIDPHLVAFSKGISHFIQHLHEPEYVTNYLEQLGARHVMLSKYGFDASMWDLFADSMMKCSYDWGGGGGVKATKKRTSGSANLGQVWSKVILFMIQRMRDGYYRALKDIRSGEKLQIAAV